MSDETITSGVPDTRFKAGNPGRRKGSRNRRTVWWEDLEQKALDDVREIVAKLTEQAKEGDTKAADLLLARLWPAPRNRKLPINLPNITDSNGLAAAYQATAKALSAGLIDPHEANLVGGLLEGQRKNLEGSDILQRVKALEALRREGGHE